MHLKKIVAFVILGLTAAQLEAVPTSSKIEEQRLEDEILKEDRILDNERSKKSVLLLNNQLPVTSQALQTLQTSASKTVETLIQPNAQILNVQSVPQTVETVNLLPNGQPVVNIQSLPQTVETVIQSNTQPAQLLNIQSSPRAVETINVQPNVQPLLNIQSLPQTVETLSIQSNSQPTQLLNIQSAPRTVETVSIQQQQPLNVQPLLNIQSLPQTVETLSIQSNTQPAQQLLNIQSAPRAVETVSIQQQQQPILSVQSTGGQLLQTSMPQTLSLQSNGLQQLVNVPQIVETFNVPQTLNLQAGQPFQTLFPQSSATVIAQQSAINPVPVPAQTNVNIVPQLPIKEVQIESVPSSVVEIGKGFVNPLAEEMIVPPLNEFSLAQAKERVVVSPSTSSFFTTVNKDPATNYVPQVYYNPRQPLTVGPSRVVSRVL
ncbi:uncharacterized protein LOC100577698 [Apis mellifera]|uniref:Uncharacterized protein LOC100577698 n=1 Tax=Apis mellifera TaxID=7460 RepID=A0A7M7GBK7_APIME|nr:uncharacterized protein LOC100577698 [Apis mellifera]|eukprot:XP_003250093.1 uncharacterized protein LOC100577698 [Apis mellifera]